MNTPNQEQYASWNGESGLRWVADADRRDRILGPIGDLLLDHTALRAGETVLDLGCGCGVTTLTAADTVEPAEVVGIDLSEPMLALARQRVRDRNVSFVHADAQTHRFVPQCFDVAISRFGTMFFDDPIAAFANVATAMRPGARLCMATWQPLEANDWLLVPGDALLEYGSLPEASGSGPGMFAQSNPDTIRRVLSAAGWHEVEVTPLRLELNLGATAADAVDYLAGTGIARAVLDNVEPAHRDEALSAVNTTLAAHETPAGVLLGCAIHLISAIA
jgi:SAM-dependent methyltransferase